MKNIVLSILSLLFISQISFCQSDKGINALKEVLASGDTTQIADKINSVITTDSEQNDKNLCLLFVADVGIMQSVKYLIEIGADVNYVFPNNGRTPLLSATASGNQNIIKYLLVNDADINARDVMATNALILASMDGNIELVKLLVDNGIDINAKMDGGYNARDMAKGKEVKKYLKEKGL